MKTESPTKYDVNALFNEGRLSFEAGRWPEAEQAFRQILLVLGDTPLKKGEQLKALNGLGHALVAQQKFDAALTSFQEATETAEALGDLANQAWQLTNIGSVYRDLAQHNQSHSYYMKSLDLFTKLADTEGAATQYANLGYACSMTGDIPKALQWFEQAARAFTLLGRYDQASLAEQNLRVLQKKEKANSNSSGPTT